MKYLSVLVLVLLAVSLSNPAIAQKKGRAVVCFQSDMDCADCEKTLFEHLKFEKGVKDLKIDHASNTILVEYVENKNDDNGLAKAIKEKGYKAEKIDRTSYDQKIAQSKEQGHNHQQETHKVRK